jgi:hypothetical protein
MVFVKKAINMDDWMKLHTNWRNSNSKTMEVKMKIKPIKNKDEHLEMLDWIESQMDTTVRKGTPEGDLLEVALFLVKDYEDKHYTPIPTIDPIEAIN